MGSGPDTIKAPKMNIGKDIQQYVSGMSGALPQMLNQEGKFRPEFQGLNLGDIQSFLSGVGGQQGIFGLGQEATQQAGQQLGEAREAELAQMTGQTGMARGLLQSMSPEAAAQVQRSSQEAERAFAAAQGLTPEQRRMSDQQSRESFASRGMLGSTGSVASEILNREGFKSGLRNEAAQRGNEAFNLGQSFYSQPGLAMLGSAPLSYQAGQNQLGLGLGAIGAGTPQLFDPAVGLNLGAAQRQNQLSAASANQQAKATHSAGIMSMIGGIGGAALMAPMTGGASLGGLALGKAGSFFK